MATIKISFLKGTVRGGGASLPVTGTATAGGAQITIPSGVTRVDVVSDVFALVAIAATPNPTTAGTIVTPGKPVSVAVTAEYKIAVVLAPSIPGYQEKVWTPTIGLAAGGPITGATYHAATYGKAVRVGALVNVLGSVLLNSKGSGGGSNAVVVNGLPWSVTGAVPASCVALDGMGLTSGNILGGYLAASQMTLRSLNNLGSAGVLWDTGLTNATDFMFSGSYITADA